LAVGCSRTGKATTDMDVTPLAVRQSYCCASESATHKLQKVPIGRGEKQ
jgi:hypothetical protein